MHSRWDILRQPSTSSAADSAHASQVFLEANGWHAQHERDVCVAYDQEHRSHGYHQVCPVCIIRPRFQDWATPLFASCAILELSGLQHLQQASHQLECPASA